jgi:hypothetical protein
MSANVPMWSQIEVDAGIVAASILTLRPLLKSLTSAYTTRRSMRVSFVRFIPETRDSWAKTKSSTPSHPSFSRERDVTSVMFSVDEMNEELEKEIGRPWTNGSSADHKGDIGVARLTESIIVPEDAARSKCTGGG